MVKRVKKDVTILKAHVENSYVPFIMLYHAANGHGEDTLRLTTGKDCSTLSSVKGLGYGASSDCGKKCAEIKSKKCKEDDDKQACLIVIHG